MKRKLGYKYINPSYILLKIDELAYESNQKGPGITKAFSDLWAEKSPNESPKTKYMRVLTLARLSAFISDFGIKSYIPFSPKNIKSTFTPYIFSNSEINKIFKHCDSIELLQRNSISNLFSFPLMIRFLYATGIRIGEALKLMENHVNLENNFIFITDSKSGTERTIPISTSLVKACKHYNIYKKYIIKNPKKDNHFFVNAKGEKCGKGISNYFRKSLREIGIICHGSNRTPRLHDLRHTFAVNSLINMTNLGLDPYASLPILSTYLGHSHIQSTEYYVRLTTHMFPDIIKQTELGCIDVFPKL